MAPFLTTDYLKKLFEPAGSAFVAFLFWIIFQYVFKMDFKCPCDPKENIHVCAVYMTCPAISLFILVMIIDKHIRSIFCRNGTGKTYKCIIILMSFIKAFSVANLWIITVLMDGDWYVCLTTTNYDLPPYEQIFCKLKKNPAEAAEIRVKKSLSREIAILVLFGVSVLWAITSVRQSHCKRPLAYQYNKYFLEKADLYITEELKKMAEDNAKTRVQEQIHDVRSFLQLNGSQLDIPETQQQLKRVPQGTLQSTSQAASDQANQEKLDQSSDSCTISSEHFGESADNIPLLHGKSEKAVSLF